MVIWLFNPRYNKIPAAAHPVPLRSMHKVKLGTNGDKWGAGTLRHLTWRG